MPKATGNGGPAKSPSPARRSYHFAYSAVRHRFERTHDRWSEKDRQGASSPGSWDPRPWDHHGKPDGDADPHAATKADTQEHTKDNTKEALRRRAAQLRVRGRSKMTKDELAEAIARHQGEQGERGEQW